MNHPARIAIVGARGYAGAELIRLLTGHPQLDIGYAGSRALAGKPVKHTVAEVDDALLFTDVSCEALLAAQCDAVVLALPNNKSAPFVAALRGQRGRIRGAPVVIVDLSADHRFDGDWQYGLVEHHRSVLVGATRIANPGCYATAAQLALTPFVHLLCACPSIFGVSGYSGAGTTPSPRNDPENLRDNLIPYALVDHMHEHEISDQLGHSVHFMPHVASFFRGISLTINMQLSKDVTAAELTTLLHDHYPEEPLVSICEDVPLVRDAVGHHGVHIGGIYCSEKRAVIVATIDNLLKGAATQCVQNLNLALALPELAGIPLERQTG